MSRIEKRSKSTREALLAKNIFNTGSEYNVSHVNALSDGDEHGKGEKGSSIGGLTDIKMRKTLLAKNMYNSGSEYNVSNA